MSNEKFENQCPEEWGCTTRAVHAGEARQKPGHAMTDAIFCTSTYTFSSSQAVHEFLDQGIPREEYGRYGNPSERVVERKLAMLDKAPYGVLFASGMAAITSLLTVKLKAGDEVVLFDECYHRTRSFLTDVLGKFGITTHKIPACDFDQMEAAMNENTAMLISESPTNPHLSVVDLERFVELGKKYNVETMIDSTLATPYNLTPYEWGVDYIIHSATKYLGGHNDLLAGVLIGSEEKVEPVRKYRGLAGNLTAPHSNYLLQRGLKTFELRMQRHNENGQAVAEFLEAHPRIEKVYYPGLPSHRDHEIAKKTMKPGYGGLVTFLVKGCDHIETGHIVDKLQLPRIGPSLGGVESLVEQPIIMSYHDFTIEQRRGLGIQDNMIRLALGIENTQDLLDDLKQALS